MSKYLSIDTEATGLEENTYLIQLALVPIDVPARKVHEELGFETLVKCPSFEELKPTLNPWVIEHNEGLIRKAHAEGVTQERLKQLVGDYMESTPVRAVFGKDRPAFFGKSLSALDIPLMTRYFGKPFMERYFHHHTLDLTCVSRALVDSGVLPAGCESTTQLVRYFGLRDDARHTALSDALDMAVIYFKEIDLLQSLKAGR